MLTAQDSATSEFLTIGPPSGHDSDQRLSSGNQKLTRSVKLLSVVQRIEEGINSVPEFGRNLIVRRTG